MLCLEKYNQVLAAQAGAGLIAALGLIFLTCEVVGLIGSLEDSAAVL